MCAIFSTKLSKAKLLINEASIHTIYLLSRDNCLRKWRSGLEVVTLGYFKSIFRRVDIRPDKNVCGP